MKIDETILNHIEWKIKLADYLIRPDKSITPESCHESCCELTKWVHTSEASNYLNDNDLNELHKVHKEFHRKIAEIVFNANRGVVISEEMAIGVDSKFHRISENLMRHLCKLKEVENKAA